MISIMTSLVISLTPEIIIHVWPVIAATRSARVRTIAESNPPEKTPADVGSVRPCPGGIAIADCPSLNFDESERSTRVPFSSSVILTLRVPFENCVLNSVISSDVIKSTEI